MKQEMDFVKRWAKYVKENPSKWKKQHTNFINAIYQKHYQWKARILEKPNGKEIIKKLYGI
jgi:hypothetical protein